MRYRELERIHLRADSAYRPRPYHGPVTLFRATRDSPSATLGWESVALGGIQVVDVDASHDNLIEQPAFARALRASLQRAHEAQRSGVRAGSGRNA